MQQKQTKLTGSVKETRRGRFQVSRLRGGRVQLAYEVREQEVVADGDQVVRVTHTNRISVTLPVAEAN